MGHSKVVVPKKLIVDPARMARTITNTLNAQAKAIKADFGVVAQTWEHDPGFVVESPSPYERFIGTADPVFAILNTGTRPHAILPRRGTHLVFNTPFRSKTLPRTIASGPGYVGPNRVFSRGVEHPGTAAREWDTTIAQKWDRLLGAIFQRAIDSEVS